MDLSSQELQLGFAKDKPTKGSGKTWFYFYLKAEAEVPLLKVCLLKVNTLSVAVFSDQRSPRFSICTGLSCASRGASGAAWKAQWSSRVCPTAI